MKIETDNLWKLKVLELVEQYLGEGCYVGINPNRPCNGWDITVIDRHLMYHRTVVLGNEVLRDAYNIDRVLEKAISILVKAKPPKNVIGSVEL